MFEDAVVLVFDSIPSDLDQIYWRCTLNDIKVKLRLYLSSRQAAFVQDYQTIALIVGQAFGSKKNKVDAVKPQTAEELKAAFGSVFG